MRKYLLLLCFSLLTFSSQAAFRLSYLQDTSLKKIITDTTATHKHKHFFFHRQKHMARIRDTTSDTSAHNDTSAFKKHKRLQSFTSQHIHYSDKKEGNWGVAALVSALLFLGPVAIVLGAIGMKKNKTNPNYAFIGFIIGLIQTIFMIIILIELILHPPK